MIKIGDFSRLGCVSVKALRLYDQIGIIKPIWTDRYTGYRYYSIEQLPRLHRIIALKDMGFSLEQIAELLDEGISLQRLIELFNNKQRELVDRLAAEQARLAHIANRLQQIEYEGCLPEIDVTIKPIPEYIVAGTHCRIETVEALPDCSNRAYHELAHWALQHHLRSLESWFVLYPTTHEPDGCQEIEVALALNLPERRIPRLSTSSFRIHRLPALPKVACLLHSGLPIDLPQSHANLLSWCERNGYYHTTPAREFNLAAPHASEENQSFVEIQLPVENIQSLKQRFLANPTRKENEMEPQFVSRPAFTVIGIRYFGKNENQEISQLWEATNPRLSEIQNVADDAAYGVCSNVEGAQPGEFEYIAGLAVNTVEYVPDGMVVRQVPAQKYAVFVHIGSLERLRDTYHYIYHVWLPQSGYQLTNGPDFELYNEEFKFFDPGSRFYIYVPIQ